MFTLEPTPKFVRSLKKLLKTRAELKETVDDVLVQLAQDPRAPELRSHKVIDVRGRKAFSSRVTGDLRIIWRYLENDAIKLEDVGGHSGKDKVYR